MSPDSPGHHDNQDVSAHHTLRAELLISGLYDHVPLAEVDSVIVSDKLAKTTAGQQELALSTIRSLVEDGLMEFVGDEDVPLNEAMAHVYDLYVNHYDDPGAWVFAVWLKLTDAGKPVAERLKAAQAAD